ncbi:MAG: transposase [Thermoplasmata archaeon]
MKEKTEKEKLDPEMREIINKTAEKYGMEIEAGRSIGLSKLLEELISAIMIKERELYLKDHEDNANGFYSRDLQMTLGKLNLEVPRVRESRNFRPAMLPDKWSRADQEYENIILALLASGYSESKIERTLRSLNLPYNQETCM